MQSNTYNLPPPLPWIKGDSYLSEKSTPKGVVSTSIGSLITLKLNIIMII